MVSALFCGLIFQFCQRVISAFLSPSLTVCHAVKNTMREKDRESLLSNVRVLFSGSCECSLAVCHRVHLTFPCNISPWFMNLCSKSVTPQDICKKEIDMKEREGKIEKE